MGQWSRWPMTDRPPLPALTGLRFFAALHVVLFHDGAVFGLSGFLEQLRQNGDTAVVLFFVLSGFVLAYVHADRPLGAKRFWQARAVRILPMHWLAVLAFLPLWLMRTSGDWPLVHRVAIPVSQALMVNVWVPLPHYAFGSNPPAWSLAVEAFFYLLFPVLLAPMARATRRRPALILLGCLALGGATHALFPLVDWPLGHWWYYVLPPVRLHAFLLGMALGVLFLDRRGVASALDRWAAPVGLVSGLLLAGLVRTSHQELMCTLLLPSFGLLIWGLAHGGFPARLLSLPPLVFLGDASYALYILQAPIMGYFALLDPAPGKLFMLVHIAVLVGVTALLHWNERPLAAWLRRRLGIDHPATISPR
jgi:peptidoglycan/LPS O-acetylase OafA/YrhL